ncbi:hypothetical protein [Acidithiobacillus ferrianus]|uniref:hypothetical protein n=1 Tax=Acidithiobacillus ferrianus TaxID=2678518 RepID=UPI0034E5D541
MSRNLRMRKLFAAHYAVIESAIRRTAVDNLRRTRDMACDHRAMAYPFDGDVHRKGGDQEIRLIFPCRLFILARVVELALKM